MPGRKSPGDAAGRPQRPGEIAERLPYAVADLRRDSLAGAWLAYRDAWRAPLVRDFIANCRADPTLLRHANELWDMPRIRAHA